MEEIWKPVPSLPGVMASSFGRICLPPRTAKMPRGGERTYTPKPTYGTETKSRKGASHSFMAVRNRIFGNIKVHRAVCEAFHGPPPKGKNIVLHLDEDGTNNRADNLKWGSQKENLNAPGFIKYCKSRTGADNPYVKGKNK